MADVEGLRCPMPEYMPPSWIPQCLRDVRVEVSEGSSLTCVKDDTLLAWLQGRVLSLAWPAWIAYIPGDPVEGKAGRPGCLAQGSQGKEKMRKSLT